MASKKKNKRAVLVTSCILAALIVAGSTFAWFTSKDEVTNRLTASAEYGVSIIENFAPPKQWIPGETVIKEEAAVNTGNVDAFVKQTISGVMTVTVEVPNAKSVDEETEDAEKAKYYELDEDEYGTLEAGSYLAWKPDGSSKELGAKVVYATNTNTEKFTNDFVPDVAGLYVFRRAVIADDTHSDTAYDYVGYYYSNDHKYYKLYSINATGLVGENGNLTSVPNVTYSKKITRTDNEVPMTFDADNSRLKVVYNAYTSNAAELSTVSKDVYNAYKEYLDSYSGKTTWNASDSYEGKTGLVDKESEESGAEVKTDYSNWSQTRLESKKADTAAALTAVTPNSWDTLYNNAKAERDTYNTGAQAQTDLASKKSEISALVGEGTNGLVQDGGTKDWSITKGKKLITDATAPETGEMTFAATVTGMTADNLDDETVYPIDGTLGTSGATYTDITNPYADSLTSSSYKTAWDTYVTKAKAAAMIQQKMALCTTAITAHSNTAVGRDNIEPAEYKSYLQDKLNELDLEGAWNAYVTEYNAVSDKVTDLNSLQDKIDAQTALNTHKVDTETLTDAEKTLYDYLVDYYGVAKKDTADKYYDPVATKTYVDSVIKYTLADGTTTTTDNAVSDKPYFEDVKAGNALNFRKGVVEGLMTAYNTQKRIYGVAESASSSDIILYIDLDNLGDGSAINKWQYIAETGTDAGKKFNFYYTNVLESGHTSNLLIKDVKFDDSVKQTAFLDMTFDVNVALESAQVVYDGDTIMSTAAKASITDAQPAADSYASVATPVKWTAGTAANGTDPKPANPTPKADDVAVNP